MPITYVYVSMSYNNNYEYSLLRLQDSYYLSASAFFHFIESELRQNLQTLLPF